jgi:hypothetical protein
MPRTSNILQFLVCKAHWEVKQPRASDNTDRTPFLLLGNLPRLPEVLEPCLSNSEWLDSRITKVSTSFKKYYGCKVPLSHTYNPSYLRSKDKEPAWANSLQDSISKNLTYKKGWWSGSYGRVPV